MDISSISFFLFASVGVTLAPGPDNLFVLAQGISHRRVLAMFAAWGMVSGISIHTALAAAGVSAILYSSAWAFTMLKIAGAGYLFFLAVQSYRSRNNGMEWNGAGEAFGKGALFRRGFFMNVLNPKVGLFFLAFLPQFVDPELAHREIQILFLGALFMLQAFIIFSLIAWFSASIGQFLRRFKNMNKYLSLTTAAIFSGLGLKLLLETT